ncbi:DUF983 domain-containing protein [Schleiferia thermophila]|nr:DUF983 domain-containing protein [Schleiferia thermophila]KFD39425.1 hypothetical protein AT05_04110 [Schleiferia thermophila str. Yellowstone]
MKFLKLVVNILSMRCPRCRTSPLFTQPNPYKISKLFEMHEKCPSCGQPYVIEPNFYYGAMYASYALAVALFVAVLVILTLIGHNEIEVLIPTYFIVLVILSPVLFRLSRSLWIHFFVKYDPECKAEK